MSVTSSAAGVVQCALDSRERPASLPPREVDRDRRSRRVCGRHRHDLARGRSSRLVAPSRSRRVGWHDATTRIRGPLVADVGQTLQPALGGGYGRATGVAPASEPAGSVAAQLVGTCPEGVYPALPRGAFGVLESYLRALRSAESLIYLETQYLWSPEIVAVLREKLARPPSDRFRSCRTAGEAQGGRRRHARSACGADRRRPRTGPGACLLPVRSRRPHRRSDLRARQDRDRGRSLVDDRLREPERPLPLQRHRAERFTHDPNLAHRTRLALWASTRMHTIRHRRRPHRHHRSPVAPDREAQLDHHRPGRPLTHRLMRLDQSHATPRACSGPVQGLLVDG